MHISKRVAFIFIIALETIVNSMEIVPFERLNTDLIGTIALQLVATIGTPRIKNETDIPIIVKNVKAFSLASKCCNQVINNEMVMNSLIKALAQRFNLTQIESAGRWSMAGSNKWLEDYVQKSGDYELFKIVQKIFDFAEIIKNEMNSKKICSLETSREDSPDTFCHQTKQGLFLHANSYPVFLCTPWGQLQIYERKWGTVLKDIAITQLFLEKMKTYFFYVQPEYKNTWYEVKKLIDWNELLKDKSEEEYKKFHDRILKLIPQTKLETFHGTQTQIVSTAESKIGSRNVLYKIVEFDEHKLPEPEFASQAECRDNMTIKALWKIMNRLYHNETLTDDMKLLKIANKKAKIENNQKEQKQDCLHCGKRCVVLCLCYLCDKKLYCSQKCKSLNFENHIENYHKKLSRHQEIVINSERVKSIDEIPQLCAYFARMLNEEALDYDNRKILPLYYSAGRICTIINNQTEKIIGEKIWRIYESPPAFLKSYIYLRLDKYDKRCDINQLQEAYETIINQVKAGWKYARLEDNPQISYKRSEEEWYLFIRQRNFYEEDTLIRFLESKFGLSDYISCDIEPCFPEILIALWIKKNKLREFNEAFKFFDEATMQKLA